MNGIIAGAVLNPVEPGLDTVCQLYPMHQFYFPKRANIKQAHPAAIQRARLYQFESQLRVRPAPPARRLFPVLRKGNHIHLIELEDGRIVAKSGIAIF